MYDEFDSTALNSKLWNTLPESGPNINSFIDLQTYKRENAVLDSGILRLEVKREPGCYDTWQYCKYDSCTAGCTVSYHDSCSNMPVRCSKVMQPGNNHCLCLVPKHFDYTGGMIISIEKYLYGTFEIKCRIPDNAPPAFWLYGECCEEIDVFEFLTEDERKFTMTVHECVPGKCDKGSGGKGHQLKGKQLMPGPDFSKGFHTWTLEWTPEFISLKVDGNEVRKCYKKGFRACNPYGIGKSLYPDKPMNVIVNSGAGKNSPAYSAMEVDYIKIWQK